MNQYKDTTHKPNTLETLKNGQIDTSTKVTLLDVIKSLLLAVLMIGLLLLISSYHQAHPKNNLLLVADMMDNRVLSNNHASGKPYRYSLAFFVPKFWKAPQANQDKDATHLTQFTGLNRHKFMAALPAVYVRKTSQNSPFWVICGAATCVAESDSEHPMTFHSVVTTQKTTQGGHNHA